MLEASQAKVLTGGVRLARSASLTPSVRTKGISQLVIYAINKSIVHFRHQYHISPVGCCQQFKATTFFSSQFTRISTLPFALIFLQQTNLCCFSFPNISTILSLYKNCVSHLCGVCFFLPQKCLADYML